MIKRIYEIFGLTDIDPATGRRPHDLTYNRNSTTFDASASVPIDPFQDKFNRANSIVGGFCTFFKTNGAICTSGCPSINLGKNKECVPYKINNINPPWYSCPCYYSILNLNDRIIRPDKDIQNLYDFGNPDDRNDPFNKAKPLSSWQYQVYQKLLRKNANLIVSVPPAGGKTRPIKVYFYEKMLRFLNDPLHNDMPRFIYFVPTKQLSVQISNNDFIRDDEYGLMALFGNLKDKSLGLQQDRQQVHNMINNLLNSPTFKSEFEKEAFLLKLAQSFVVIRSGDNPNPNYEFENDIVEKLPFLRGKIKPVIICVKGDGLVPTIKRFAKYADHIFIDETQELLIKPNMPLGKQGEEDFLNFCRVLKIAKSEKTPIHILTGSVNEISLNELQKAFEEIFKLKFEFCPNINQTIRMASGKERKLDASLTTNKSSGIVEMPGMKNRSNITVVPLQALSGPESFQDKANVIKEIVRSKQTNSIMIVFSIKNFAKTSIINLMLDVIKHLPMKPQSALYDGPAKINIALNRKSFNRPYRSSDYLKNTEQYSVNGTPGQFDISKIVAKRESEKAIRKYSDYLNRQYIQTTDEEREKLLKRKMPIPGMLADTRDNIYIDDIEFLKYFNRFELEEPKQNQNIEKMTLVKDDKNILYQCALAGIGLMIGALHPIHKDTIQRLFQKGKIYLLLATDALGVGANVDAKHIYIPTINKPTEVGFLDTDISSLTQLINRAGRGRFPNAMIYCRSEDYYTIYRLINPERVESEDNRQKSVTEIIPQIDVEKLKELMRKV